jgi:hypothetical protein
MASISLKKSFGTTFFPRNVNVKAVVHKIWKYNILNSNLTTELGTNDCTAIKNSTVYSLSAQSITTTLTLLS